MHELPAPSMTSPNDPSGAQAEEFAPLLRAFAGVAASAAPPAAPPAGKLMARVQRSAAAARAFVTTRHADTVATSPAPGVTLRPLYAAAGAATRRPGEPSRVALLELAPGAQWSGPASTEQREWLVLRGSLQIGATRLHENDYHVVPAHVTAGPLRSTDGALLYQREAPLTATSGSTWTQAAAGAEWADFAPGIQRRVMWQQHGEAAMLYRTAPGAAVPRHGHRRDEECLMLHGDVFLDDVLLRPLDYQIAPAGTGHEGVFTDTGVLLFAHGDLELDLKPA